MSENQFYINAKVIDWWRDTEFEEYFAIVEINSEWQLVIRKVEKTNV